MNLEKATFLNLATGESIAVPFNPEEYTVDAGNSFAEIAVPGARAPPIQFGRGQSRTLKVELFCDSSALPTRDVRGQTERILFLLEKDPSLNAPPVVLFLWGGAQFKGVVERVGVRFGRFLPDGTPVRAYLSVSLKEYEEARVDIQAGLFFSDASMQAVTTAGGGLAAAAALTLGDPRNWRQLANSNNIDDPRRVPPGTVLIVPRT
jgi:nucleoid-associated protein YgaU